MLFVLILVEVQQSYHFPNIIIANVKIEELFNYEQISKSIEKMKNTSMKHPKTAISHLYLICHGSNEMKDSDVELLVGAVPNLMPNRLKSLHRFCFRSYGQLTHHDFTKFNRLIKHFINFLFDIP